MSLRWNTSSILVPFLIIICCAILFLSPNLLFNLIVQGDGQFHKDCVVQFSEGIQSGVIYPSWAARFFGGLGSPVFVYYAPLFHFVSYLTAQITGNFWLAIDLVNVFAFVLTGIIVFLFLHWQGASNWLSILTGIVTAVAPFTYMTLLYVQGLPWNFAYPFIVLLCVATASLKNLRLINIALVFGIGTFLLATTHILSIFMVITCLWIGLIAYLDWSNRQDINERMVIMLVSSFLGLGIGMFYIYPALTTIGDTNESAYAGAVDWHTGFALPFFSSNWYGARWAIFQWWMGAILLWLLAYTTFLVIRWRASKNGHWQIILSILLIGWLAFLLSSDLAYPLFKQFYYFQKIQYAYRYFCIAFPSAIIAIGLCQVEINYREAGLSKKLLMSLGILSFIIILMFSLTIAIKFTLFDGLPRQELERELAWKGDRAFLPASSGKYWKTYIDTGGFPAMCERSHARCWLKTDLPENKVWEIDSYLPWEALLPVFAYPAWTLAINKAPIQPNIDRKTGLISVDLPSGKTIIELTWKTLPERKIGASLSLVSILVFLSLVGWLNWFYPANRSGM